MPTVASLMLQSLVYVSSSSLDDLEEKYLEVEEDGCEIEVRIERDNASSKSHPPPSRKTRHTVYACRRGLSQSPAYIRLSEGGHDIPL